MGYWPYQLVQDSSHQQYHIIGMEISGLILLNLHQCLIWGLECWYGVEGPPYYSTYIIKIKGLIVLAMEVEFHHFILRHNHMETCDFWKKIRVLPFPTCYKYSFQGGFLEPSNVDAPDTPQHLISIQDNAIFRTKPRVFAFSRDGYIGM